MTDLVEKVGTEMNTWSSALHKQDDLDLMAKAAIKTVFDWLDQRSDHDGSLQEFLDLARKDALDIQG